MSGANVTQNHIAGSWNDSHDEWTATGTGLSIARTKKHDAGTESHGNWSVLRNVTIVFTDESYLECRKKLAELVTRPLSSVK